MPFSIKLSNILPLGKVWLGISLLYSTATMAQPAIAADAALEAKIETQMAKMSLTTLLSSPVARRDEVAHLEVFLLGNVHFDFVLARGAAVFRVVAAEREFPFRIELGRSRTPALYGDQPDRTDKIARERLPVHRHDPLDRVALRTAITAASEKHKTQKQEEDSFHGFKVVSSQ